MDKRPRGLGNQGAQRLTHGARVADALAQVLVAGVVGEPTELVLYHRGQLRVENDAVCGCLGGELGIKVGYVKDRLL